ncbi:MAG: protease complex subunit PrcB family protein, partial [Syntrophomonadaceae bacterium]|nr:protease complex subunit PrcB family protein [Syntrophomonadaceae bacterium]
MNYRISSEKESGLVQSRGIRIIVMALVMVALLLYIGSGEAAGTVNADGVSYQTQGNEITLSWGEKPTGGYSISIVALEAQQGTLTVSYSLQAPGDKDAVIQVLTYPQAKATIPKDLNYSRVKLVRINPAPEESNSPIVINQQEWVVPLSEVIR